METLTSIAGACAATLTTISFLPQAILTIRTRNTESISLSMYLLFITGVVFWLLYGLLNKDIFIICANIITFAFALPIVIIKIVNLYHKKDISHTSNKDV